MLGSLGSLTAPCPPAIEDELSSMIEPLVGAYLFLLMIPDKPLP